MKFICNSKQFCLLLFCNLFIFTHAYSHVVVKNNSSQNTSAEKLSIEDLYEKAVNANPSPSPIICPKGYETDSSGFCEKKIKQQPIKNSQDKIIGIDPMPTSKQRSTEVALIKKYRTEIVQRCGLEESANTKITGMEDKSKRSLYETNEPWKWRPTWRITYKIDTGNIIFGEKQFANKTCVIDKLDGTATWES